MLVNPFKKLYEDCYGEDKTLPDFPIMVDVELLNYCNFQCPMCPVGNKTMKRKQGSMTEETWKIILGQLKERKTPVRFVRWGEPTLHPKLYDWIKEAKDAGLLVHINTNGKELDVDKIIESGLDSIKFSFHSETTEEIINKITELHNKLCGWVAASLTTDEKMNHLCLPFACDEFYDTPTRDLSKQSEKYLPCPEVFDKLSVNWDGSVSACCSDYDNMMIVGDIRLNTLKQIWDGEAMKYYRTMLADMRHAELPLCRNCPR